jgi:DNA-binding FadR family transcriptional regulator
MTDLAADTVQPRRSVLASAEPRKPSARLGVAVVDDLVAAVVTGELQPGEVLPPEGVLSERFGVSRTVIRESVKRVEEKGLLVVAQGRGTTVTGPGAWNVLDPVVLSALLDHDDTLGVLDELSIVRGSLEASMASAAAARQNTERSRQLVDAFHQTEIHLDDFDAYNEADANFHYTIMDQSGIRLAESITRILFARARESQRFTGTAGPPALLVTLDEHRAILEAITAGDSEAAAKAMSDHISRAWERRRLPNHRPAD